MRALLQRIERAGRAGEVDTGGVELEERIDQIFSGPGNTGEPVGQLEVAGGSDHGVAFP